MNPWYQFPTDRLLLEFSLWSADLTRLGEDLRRTERHADLFHIDVADGHFVPNLLFFPDLVAQLRPLTTTPFHVHLMAADPSSLIDRFVEAGADVLTVHCELGKAVPALLRQVRQHGRSPGLAVRLDTAVEQVLPYLSQIDVLVMMGTHLGVKGQGLSPLACPRIRAMRALLPQAAQPIRIIADGGIRSESVPVLREAGADGVVAGSVVFGSADLERTTTWLRSLKSFGDTGEGLDVTQP